MWPTVAEHKAKDIFLKISDVHYVTVGNRVVKIQKSDSSRFCLFIFNSIVNTPTKKKPHQGTPCYLSVFRYLPSKSKLSRKSCSFLAVEGSILEANISSSVRILFRIYILVRKVFWSAFQWCIWIFCHFCSFWIRGKNAEELMKIC